MKITFTCKLTMIDDIEDSEIKGLIPLDDIVKDLIKDLKEGLTEKGTVDITDYSSSTN